MIYGTSGYSILNNSSIFPNNEIILLADSHDEKYKKCDPDNIYNTDIQINDFLESLLNKNHILMIEEIPNTKDLVPLFPESTHVKNVRDFYIKSQHNKNLIPIDIRFEFIDNYEEGYYDDQILTDFNLFVKKNKLYMYDKIKNIPNKDILIDNINNILSDIMELYVLMKLFEIFITNKKSNIKIIIYTGLYHTDNIKQALLKYYKFTEIKKDGITEMKDKHKYIRDCINLII